MRGRYCGWGHITANSSQEACCALCAGEHRTEQHRCPWKGGKTRRALTHQPVRLRRPRRWGEEEGDP